MILVTTSVPGDRDVALAVNHPGGDEREGASARGGREHRKAETPRRGAYARARFTQQGRQDSNLQPPVLETGALPIELRPSVAATSVAPVTGRFSGALLTTLQR